MKRNVYIVMCYCPLKDIGTCVMFGAEERFYIDSVWTSERKANKKCSELNSDKRREWREDYGYGIFSVEPKTLSK